MYNEKSSTEYWYQSSGPVLVQVWLWQHQFVMPAPATPAITETNTTEHLHTHLQYQTLPLHQISLPIMHPCTGLGQLTTDWVTHTNTHTWASTYSVLNTCLCTFVFMLHVPLSKFDLQWPCFVLCSGFLPALCEYTVYCVFDHCLLFELLKLPCLILTIWPKPWHGISYDHAFIYCLLYLPCKRDS